MTSKDCGNHGKGRQKLLGRIIGCLLVFLVIVLITILIIWAVLRPTKPRFILQDTTVYGFNTSTPNFLTSNFQVTVSSRNPNDRIGIYYDRLVTYATYRNQQITLRTALPPTYQGHKEINVWSPFIYGNMVPIAPDFSAALKTEQAVGSVFMVIKIDGRVRWKVGSFISGRYHLHVRCPAYITFGSRSNGVSVGENAIKYQLVTRCSVSV
ncbi:vacuolar protein sorting-associated protein 4A-like [Hibiscus syriacus]|uniref:Vacuolar protein sorting-associated protein 4A-like n=1 Tax=Hibiscus syriacus TaxID=106335 RepID=A0A6A3BGX6_HIBSY|nr:NDR1/HIN1-like protein 12 [Hibiscus syriacus]KAE8715297.1 vacuolar protein sorting-associated protein 4A-like [Hibiscus syriacus]